MKVKRSARGQARGLRARDTYLNYLTLALISAIGVTLLVYRVGDPFSGFHGSNEGFYSVLAQKYMQMPVHSILTSPLDFNNPPFFALLLVIAFKLAGVSEAAARSVPMLFFLLSALFVYRLGALLYSERAGSTAAALLLVSPGFLLVGRNVQVDSALVFFMLASLYYYVDATERDSVRSAVISGALLGAGFLTKMPAVLLPVGIVAWHLLREKNLSWLNKRFMAFVLSAAAVGAPWYLYHILVNREIFLNSQGYLAGTIDVPSVSVVRELFLTELFWALSPVVFLLAVASLVYAIQSKDHRGYVIMAIISAITIFYFFYHFHTYYLLPLFPLLLLLVGGMLDRLFKQAVWLSVVTLVLALMSSLFAVAMLSSHKYGFTMVAQAAQAVKSSPANSVLLELPDRVKASDGSALDFYFPGVEMRTDSPEAFPKDRQVYWLLAPRAVSDSYLAREGVVPCTREVVLPIIFGYRVSTQGHHPHRFSMGRLMFERWPDALFGFSKEERGELLLIDWTKLGTPSSNEVVL